MVPRSSRMIPYRAQEVEAEEAVVESNSPRSSSGIPDHQRESPLAGSRRTGGRCNDSQPDAKRRNDKTRCSQYRSHRSVTSSPADTASWSRHNRAAAERLRKCSLCELIRRSIRHRSPEHHTHTGFGTWWTELPMSLMLYSKSRHRSQNMGPESLSSNSSIRCSRYDVAQRLPPVPVLDPALVAGMSSCPHNGPQVLGFHRVPESSE